MHDECIDTKSSAVLVQICNIFGTFTNDVAQIWRFEWSFWNKTCRRYNQFSFV